VQDLTRFGGVHEEHGVERWYRAIDPQTPGFFDANAEVTVEIFPGPEHHRVEQRVGASVFVFYLLDAIDASLDIDREDQNGAGGDSQDGERHDRFEQNSSCAPPTCFTGIHDCFLLADAVWLG
jgi:hypothetical protein